MSTLFVPYRLARGMGSSVTLELKIRNDAKDEKLVSVVVEVPETLSLNQSGYVRRREQRVGTVLPGESKNLSFTIYSKPTTREGTHTIRVLIYEHFNDYDYVIKEHVKELSLTVV